MADVAGLVRRAPDAGIFCDFDGALAPIVDDPEDARLLPGANRVLAQLAGRFKVVAVISGRAARDLATRVKAPGVRLVGLHGMEEITDGRVSVAPQAEASRERIESAAADLRSELRGVRGAILEHKGLALAVHFRRAGDPDEAERTSAPIVARAAVRHRLEVLPGRRILEVRPRAGGDKGDAVRALIRRKSLVAGLYGGDDVGDVPAFGALDGLEVAVRIAVSSDESPAELLDRADLVLASPAAFLAFLRRLTAGTP